MAPVVVRCCFKAIQWAPVLFISAVIAWSYYAYVVQMCIFTVDNQAEKAIYLILYHPLFVMFIWSYWKTIFAGLAVVPKQFFLSPQDVDKFEHEDSETNQREILARIANDLPVQCRTVNGAVRYCEKCKCVKPDRCHHCSVCGMCVLKMDHHCPWVNSCICFSNYKFFVLFLGYAFLYCVFLASTSCQYFVHFWTKGLGQDFGKFHILFLFFASIMFAISLISLLGYHLYLIGLNRSTLESFRAPIFLSGPDKHGFNLGRRGNFQEIFGDQKATWILPKFSSLGDGVNYPSRTSGAPSRTSGAPYYNTMGITAPSPTSPPLPPAPVETESESPSMGDGVTYPTRTVDIASDSLLGQRQRWAEEGEEETYGATEKLGYTNEVALTVMSD